MTFNHIQTPTACFRIDCFSPERNRSDTCTLSIQTFSDRVAMKTLSKFRSLVASVSEDLSGREVIAAILLYDDIEDQLSVVSLGTGIHGYVTYAGT